MSGTPTFEAGETSGEKEGGTEVVQETREAWVAKQTSTLMALLSSPDIVSTTAAQANKVWLGVGLGAIPKRTHEKMLRWEFVDLGEFRPRTTIDRATLEADTEKLVVLPGFEVSQTRKKPVTNIVTWAQCFARYTAAMAQIAHQVL